MDDGVGGGGVGGKCDFWLEALPCKFIKTADVVCLATDTGEQVFDITSQSPALPAARSSNPVLKRPLFRHCSPGNGNTTCNSDTTSSTTHRPAVYKLGFASVASCSNNNCFKWSGFRVFSNFHFQLPPNCGNKCLLSASGRGGDAISWDTHSLHMMCGQFANGHFVKIHFTGNIVCDWTS